MKTDGLAIFIDDEIMAIQDLTFFEKGLLAKLRYLDNDKHCWASNKYLADYFGVSSRTISRTVNKLADLGYINAIVDDKGGYRIIDTENVTPRQNVHTPRQNDYTPTTDCLPNNIDNNINNNIDIKCIKWSFTPKEIKPTLSFSYEILQKQILLCNKKVGIPNKYLNEAYKTIAYYYDKYYETFYERHPNLSNKAMCGVLQKYAEGSEMVECYTDAETYEILIDKHFETEYKNCDYNICHFMTDGILDNRFYETCY